MDAARQAGAADLRKPVDPGYAAIGRLKGRAGLRGAIRVLGG